MADIYFDPDNTADGSRDGSSGHPFLDPSELPTAWLLVGGNNYYFKCGTVTNFDTCFGINTSSTSPITIGAWGTGAKPIITMYREVGAEECTEVSMDAAGVTTPASGTNLWKVPRQFFGLYGGDEWGVRRDWVNALGYGVQALTSARHWEWADGNTSCVVYSEGNPVTVYGGLYALNISDADWATDWKRNIFFARKVDNFTVSGIDMRYAMYGVRMTADTLILPGEHTVSGCTFRSMYRGITFGGMIPGGGVQTDAGGFSKIRVHGNYFENMGIAAVDAASATGGTRMNNTRIYHNVINGFGAATGWGAIYLGRCFTSDGSQIAVTLNSISGGIFGNYFIYDGYALYAENSTQDVLWDRNFIWNCDAYCHTNYPGRRVVWRNNVGFSKINAAATKMFTRTNAYAGKPGNVTYQGNVAVGFSRFLAITSTSAERGIVRVTRNISLAEYPGGSWHPDAALADHSDTSALVIDGNNFYGHEHQWFDSVAVSVHDDAPYVTNKITTDPSSELARLPVPTDPTVNYALQIRTSNRIKAGGVVDLRPGTRVVV